MHALASRNTRLTPSRPLCVSHHRTCVSHPFSSYFGRSGSFEDYDIADYKDVRKPYLKGSIKAVSDAPLS
jgi:hypothetical protein